MKTLKFAIASILLPIASANADTITVDNTVVDRSSTQTVSTMRDADKDYESRTKRRSCLWKRDFSELEIPSRPSLGFSVRRMNEVSTKLHTTTSIRSIGDTSYMDETIYDESYYYKATSTIRVVPSRRR